MTTKDSANRPSVVDTYMKRRARPEQNPIEKEYIKQKNIASPAQH